MYLVYIDESGVPHGGNNEGRFFVLSAVIAHDKCWQDINTKAYKIKLLHFPTKNPTQLEFKMYDIWQGKRQYHGINLETKRKYLHDIFSLFIDADLTVVSIVVKKKEWIEKYPRLNFIDIAWQNLMERIEMFLTSEGNRENGLLIMDSENAKEDDKIRKYVESVRKKGTTHVSIDHLIEDIFFTNSELRNLTQLADAAAFCTRQHMRDNIDIQPYWNMLETRLRRNAQGNYFGIGLKIIP